MNQRRLLITGGSGYLGGELIRLAQAAAWAVIATYHQRPLAHPGVLCVPLDIRDHAQTVYTLAELRPDIVIHTAYQQDGPDSWSITAEGARAVANAAQQIDARLIHLSSDVIFDGEQSAAYLESDPPTPITPYGAAKAAAERMVAEAHPQALIVRTSLIYGGDTLSKHEQFVLDVADRRRQAIFFTDEFRCPIQVGDLARALLEVAPMPGAGILNIAGPEAVSRYTFACLVAAVHGRSVDELRSGTSTGSEIRRPRNCVLDSSRARQVLQTYLRGIHEVLQPTSRRNGGPF